MIVVMCVCVIDDDVMCCDQDGRTALILAAMWGNTKTAQALIALGADIEAKDNVSTPYTHDMP